MRGSALNAYQGSNINGYLLNANGGKLNFYIPGAIDDGETILAIAGTGASDITNSTVNLDFDGSATSLSLLTEGESIKLIETTGGGSLTGNSNPTATLTSGMAFSADFSLSNDGSNLITSRDVTSASPGILLNEQTKALSEGFLSAMTSLNQVQDFTVDRGLSSAMQAGRSGTNGFASIGYGKMRHNTGSYIDTNGYSPIAGLTSFTPTSADDLRPAAFIEYGEGSYDSYNSFSDAESVNGSGDTKYTGMGILARFSFNFNENSVGKLYLDASLRAGKITTDFGGDFFNGYALHTAYDSQSSYTSTHIGAGYALDLTEESKLDIYGQYLWSNQDGDTIELTTGETVEFEDVDSKRTRVGVKWNYAFNTRTTAYIGAAWEHEYDGKANASIYSYKLDTPKLTGDDGMAEVGLTLTPNADKEGWSIDLSAQGYDGKREGITGSLKTKYGF